MELFFKLNCNMSFYESQIFIKNINKLINKKILKVAKNKNTLPKISFIIPAIHSPLALTNDLENINFVIEQHQSTILNGKLYNDLGLKGILLNPTICNSEFSKSINAIYEEGGGHYFDSKNWC
ncbi:Uncharacterised protein [Mycoplasmopsis bovigenitalium]|uniref:Uncharacterized protein n=2 Tax=Mycoplasmopsis bovigenitalium TaxID=2112 RepID=A0A449A9L1_9BACT|nr:Uncharacterised protein [Mycoplasmopsis bovigenitalium]